jgi:uncharacterized membrane protein
MKAAPYANEAEWRHVVILQLISLREAIYFVAFIIALIGVGFVASHWWPDAVSVAISVAFAVALLNYFRSSRSSSKSEKSYSKIDYDSEPDYE